ncbi:MAG: hypothetical protein WCF91_02580, partial [bacterium]
GFNIQTNDRTYDKAPADITLMAGSFTTTNVDCAYSVALFGLYCATSGGSINMYAGSTTIGTAGHVNIAGGDTYAVGSNATAVAGDVNLSGGASYTGTGGSIYIEPGFGSNLYNNGYYNGGNGNSGELHLGYSNASKIYLGTSGTTTYVSSNLYLQDSGGNNKFTVNQSTGNTGISGILTANSTTNLKGVTTLQNTAANTFVVQTGTANYTAFRVSTGSTTANKVEAYLAASLGNAAMCASANGGSAANNNNVLTIGDCSSSPQADYAEQYPVAQGAIYGDIVVTGSKLVNTYSENDGNVDWNMVKGQVTELIKSNVQYQANAIGIVSENYGDFTSAGHNIKAEDNPMPVALSGRVPVNIAPDSEAIEPGDFITTSGTHAGKGTKATGAGYIVGKALEAWDPASGKTQVMMFVQNGFYPGPSMTSYIQNGGNASLSNLDVTGTANFGDINMSGVANLNELKVVTATVSGNLEVKGLLKVADIEVNGHIITKGDTPTIAAETNAGKDAVCSVSGNDTSGKITITTGTADWANGAQCTITFKKPYSSTPNPVITPAYVLGATTDTSAIKPYVDADTNTMRINFNAADNAPRTYIFNYFNAQ